MVGIPVAFNCPELHNASETSSCDSGLMRTTLAFTAAAAFLITYQCVAADTSRYDALMAKAQRGDAAAEYEVGMALYQKCDDYYIQIVGCGKVETGYVLGGLAGPDFRSAARWFSRAAEQGYPVAEYRLAASYEFGRGVPMNFAEAANWYQKAAESGYHEALYPLGAVNVKMGDLVTAYTWLNAYAARGSVNPNAIELRNRIVREISPSQIVEAQQRSSAWCEASGGC